MIPGTLVAVIVGWGIGTFFQIVVFGLNDTDSITAAGAWGYVAGVFVIAVMALPACIGVVLGLRARRLGQQGRATTAIAVNGVIAAYLILVQIINLVAA